MEIIMYKKKKIMTYAALTLISVVFLIPLYYTIINSLRPLYTPQVCFPKKIVFNNYKLAVTLIPFGRYLKNSLMIVSISLVLGVFVNFFYGYAFARIKVKGNGFWFMLTLAQMMIPAIAMQIPQYILYSKLGIRDTYWIWVINGLAGSPFTIFLYRQYMMSIPKEIEEAAVIDGCSYVSMIPRIFMPMCKSVMAIVVFNTFMGNWGDYMTPFMYLSQKKYPLSLALFGVNYTLPQNPNVALGPVKNAAALLLAIPVFAVFFLCQKQLVAGVTAGSVKG